MCIYVCTHVYLYTGCAFVCTHVCLHCMCQVPPFPPPRAGRSPLSQPGCHLLGSSLEAQSQNQARSLGRDPPRDQSREGEPKGVQSQAERGWAWARSLPESWDTLRTLLQEAAWCTRVPHRGLSSGKRKCQSGRENWRLGSALPGPERAGGGAGLTAERTKCVYCPKALGLKRWTARGQEVLYSPCLQSRVLSFADCQYTGFVLSLSSSGFNPLLPLNQLSGRCHPVLPCPAAALGLRPALASPSL